MCSKANKVIRIVSLVKNHKTFPVVSSPLKFCLQVIVNVRDENDNKPIFERDVYKFSVVGTKPVNEEVDYVLAKDLDAGFNGDVTYSIMPPTTADGNCHKSAVVTVFT